MSDPGEGQQSLEVKSALLYERVRQITESLKNYVTKQEFVPVKLLVYGYTAIILGAATTALMSTVIRHSPLP